MKTSIKTIAAAIALTALVAGPASAMISQGQLNQDLHSVVGSGSNVFASVDGGTVTITGSFADAADKNAALRTAAAAIGVDQVINNATKSN